MLIKFYNYMNEATEFGDGGGSGAGEEFETEVSDESDEPELSFEEWQAQQNGDSDEDSSDGKPDSDVDDNTEDEAKEDEAKDEEPAEGKDKAEDSKGAKSEVKVYKVKVDGKEEEIEVKESEIPALMSKAIAAQQRFEDAANIRKEAQEFVQFIKSNPVEALKRAGIDFQELAESHLMEQIKYSQMSDVEREAHDSKQTLAQREAELKRYKDQEEAQRKSQEEAQKAQEQERAVNEQRDVLQGQIIQAMEASNLPRNKFTVSRMAGYMRAGLARGQNLGPMDVIDHVKADYAEVLEQARKQDVERFKQSKQTIKQPVKTKHKPNNKSKKRISSIYDLLD